MDFSIIKGRVNNILSKHYLMYVVICLFVAFIGLELTVPFKLLMGVLEEGTGFEIKTIGDSSRFIEGASINVDLATGEVTIDVNNPVAAADWKKNAKNDTVEYYKELGPVTMENRDGIFAQIYNFVSSNTVYGLIESGIRSIFKTDSAVIIVFIIITLEAQMFVALFVKRVFLVISRRYFLEARIYDRVPLRKSLFLIQVRRWLNVGLVLASALLENIVMAFTIVGGVERYFAYYALPYILAENPTMSPRHAMTLSKNIMKGHKWECFRLKFSFLGWDLLSFCTFGTMGIMFVNPYKAAVFTEYFAELRSLAIAAKVEDYELLNDKYLYEKADEYFLSGVYADMLGIMQTPIPKPEKRSGIAAFFADTFGIILREDKKEDELSLYYEQLLQIRSAREVIKHHIYPERTFPSRPKKLFGKWQHLHYLRRYSLTSIIIMFFSFSLFGWLWEVGIHLVRDGVFVNRGVLMGPWLPIYGGGGVLIVLLLYKFRAKPWLEASLIVVLCGVVEYFTSWFLEMKYDTKWWDYTGYYAHINGRICAEGLFAFASGGLVIVYLVAPLLDNLLSRIKDRILVPICAVLLIVFLADVICSYASPNMGKGITDYGTKAEVTAVETVQQSDVYGGRVTAG